MFGCAFATGVKSDITTEGVEKIGVKGGISGSMGLVEETGDWLNSVVRIVARSNGGGSFSLSEGVGVSDGGRGRGRYEGLDPSSIGTANAGMSNVDVDAAEGGGTEGNGRTLLPLPNEGVVECPPDGGGRGGG